MNLPSQDYKSCWEQIQKADKKRNERHFNLQSSKLVVEKFSVHITELLRTVPAITFQLLVCETRRTQPAYAANITASCSAQQSGKGGEQQGNMTLRFALRMKHRCSIMRLRDLPVSLLRLNCIEVSSVFLVLEELKYLLSFKKQLQRKQCRL